MLAMGVVALAIAAERSGVGGFAGLADDPGVRPTAPARAAAVSAPPPARPSALAPRGVAPLPDSLAGTDVDGGLLVDAAGRFVPTQDALDLFDYFLAASGEEPLERIRERIEAEITRRLPPSARPAARDLLNRYLAYREALRALHAEGLGDAPLARRLQRVREVRRGFFDAREQEAFFADEEARWAGELERRRVARDASLDADERERRLEALEGELPDAVRETRRAALLAVELRREEAALRAAGAAPGEIDALREARVGRAAADRLAELDRAREAWRQRMDAWRAEKARLEAEGAPAETIDAARARRFTGPELVRVRALERMAASAP